MPDERLHPLGIEGWEYQEGRSFLARGVTLHGYRHDTPAGLPLVTAWAPTKEEALLALVEKAHTWDSEVAR